MLCFVYTLPAAALLAATGYLATLLEGGLGPAGDGAVTKTGGAPRVQLPPIPERVFLVTGATDGIGKFTAELLASEGATVLVHGRNATRIQATVEELRGVAPNAKVHGFRADLSLMSEVRELAREVRSQFPAIHGLLNNAGTFDGDYTGSRRETPEGNEYTLAVNVMAPFLLSSLLLGAVNASGAGRILVTSSYSGGASEQSHLDDLQLREGWSAHTAYSLSKLCDGMMAMEMHRRYGNAPRLCFHTMDPETADTKMLRAGWWEGGPPVRQATKSFDMLTKDAFQRLSGENLGAGTGAPGQSEQLWADLVALTGARWPETAYVG